MNSKELERIDSEKMYEVYDKWPQTAKESYEMNLEKFNVKDVDHIVFAGMGGSGTIGDVMSSLLSKDDIHVSIVKGYLLPKTVDSNTLVVLTSISGNTDETLTVLKNNLKSNAKFIAFSSGGKLQELSQKNNIFHLFLGHHYDDNLETFILRKIAGSNFEGLNSIKFLTILGNVQVVRPLLLYTKRDILSFNKKLNLLFINDPSNQNTKYSRVAIRKFLNSNNNVQKEINREFRLIKDNYHSYKKMIYQLLNLITIEVGFKKLILNTKEFFLLNQEFKINILTKGMKYVNDSNFKIRSKKIENLLRKIYEFRNISLKSNKTLIDRIDEKLVIVKC